MVSKDYYHILQVTPDAVGEVIEAAYKRLAFKYHPDRNPEEGDLRLRDVIEAYETLGNPERRRNYDLQRLAQRKELVNDLAAYVASLFNNGLSAKESIEHLLESGIDLETASLAVSLAHDHHTRRKAQQNAQTPPPRGGSTASTVGKDASPSVSKSRPHPPLFSQCAAYWSVLRSSVSPAFVRMKQLAPRNAVSLCLAGAVVVWSAIVVTTLIWVSLMLATAPSHRAYSSPKHPSSTPEVLSTQNMQAARLSSVQNREFPREAQSSLIGANSSLQRSNFAERITLGTVTAFSDGVPRFESSVRIGNVRVSYNQSTVSAHEASELGSYLANKVWPSRNPKSETKHISVFSANGRKGLVLSVRRENGSTAAITKTAARIARGISLSVFNGAPVDVKVIDEESLYAFVVPFSWNESAAADHR